MANLDRQTKGLRQLLATKTTFSTRILGVTHANHVYTQPMKTLQVRKVPDVIHKTLRKRALDAGVSLSDYVLEELARIASKPPIADVLLRASSDTHLSTSTIVKAVRSGRDRN